MEMRPGIAVRAERERALTAPATTSSPRPAAQTEARLTAARGAAADTEYGAVRNDAGPVNVQHVIDHIDANVPAGNGQGAWTGLTVRLLNGAGNQDNCKGQAITIDYTANGS